MVAMSYTEAERKTVQVSLLSNLLIFLMAKLMGWLLGNEKKPEESGIAVAKIENKARVNLSSLTILAWCVSRFNYAPHIIPYGKSNEDKSFFRFISSPLTRWKKNVI